jgi:hypothetical protein
MRHRDTRRVGIVMHVLPVYPQGGRLPLVLAELATRLRHGASRAAGRRRYPATDGGQGLA